MDKENRTDYKKRQFYFIDKVFQTRFILKFCILVAIGGVLTIGILYLLAMKSTTVSLANSRVVVKTTADFILPILVQTVLIVTIIVSIATIGVTLFVSHKIVGPLYRLRQVMKLLGDGDFSTGFRIRRLDQMQGLADDFNNMITKIREELKFLKGQFSSFKGKLDKIPEHEFEENRKLYITELKKISKELDEIIGHFKT